VDAQREYIAELEATIRLKEEENVAWIAQIHGQVKHFMTDALEAITVRYKTIALHAKLNGRICLLLSPWILPSVFSLHRSSSLIHNLSECYHKISVY
jgi:hypothetical protein